MPADTNAIKGEESQIPIQKEVEKTEKMSCTQMQKNISDIMNGNEKNELFRKQKGIQPYSLTSGDTVANITVNDTTYFGVNSSITPDSKEDTKELREQWLRKIQWVPPKKTAPKHLGYAQSLTHAEANALMNAYEAEKALPKKITMYVDRKTCNICKGELPIILKAMGVEELEVYSGGSMKPVIIKALL